MIGTYRVGANAPKSIAGKSVKEGDTVDLSVADADEGVRARYLTLLQGSGGTPGEIPHATTGAGAAQKSADDRDAAKIAELPVSEHASAGDKGETAEDAEKRQKEEDAAALKAKEEADAKAAEENPEPAEEATDEADEKPAAKGGRRKASS